MTAHDAALGSDQVRRSRRQSFNWSGNQRDPLVIPNGSHLPGVDGPGVFERLGLYPPIAAAASQLVEAVMLRLPFGWRLGVGRCFDFRLRLIFSAGAVVPATARNARTEGWGN